MAAATFIGLMSGTSLDGVDACLLELERDNQRVAASLTRPFDSDLRDQLEGLSRADSVPVTGLARAEQALTRHYAEAIAELLATSGRATDSVDAIGCHGQTLRHLPHLGFSWQIGNPAALAIATGIPVVADFRSADLALGGQGAPLAPAFHEAFFAAEGEHRMAVNIGGIANVSDLRPGAAVTGWDTGPGNTLMDAWFREHHVQGHWDENGDWAAGGEMNPALLERLLADSYFSRPPPKSTGPEHFNLAWLREALHDAPEADPRTVQATLLALTAETIARAAIAAGARALIVCGGGAFNRALMTALADRLPGVRVETADSHGIPADQVESAGFAWLARQRLAGEAGNRPAVTGARQATPLGGLWLPAPH